MLKIISVPLALSIVLMSCATKESDRPHATVTLRDGSTVAGSVVSSSASEIALAGDDKSSRTIPMSQVKSIEYDDPQQAAAVPDPAQPAAPVSNSRAETSRAIPGRAPGALPPSAVGRQHSYLSTSRGNGNLRAY